MQDVLRANTLQNGICAPLAQEFSQSPTLTNNDNQGATTERSSLLKRANSRSTSNRRQSRRRSSSASGHHGDATVTQAVLMVGPLVVIYCTSHTLKLEYLVAQILYWDRSIVFRQGFFQWRCLVLGGHFGIRWLGIIMGIPSSGEDQAGHQRKLWRWENLHLRSPLRLSCLTLPSLSHRYWGRSIWVPNAVCDPNFHHPLTTWLHMHVFNLRCI